MTKHGSVPAIIIISQMFAFTHFRSICFSHLVVPHLRRIPDRRGHHRPRSRAQLEENFSLAPALQLVVHDLDRVRVGFDTLAVQRGAARVLRFHGNPVVRRRAADDRQGHFHGRRLGGLLLVHCGEPECGKTSGRGCCYVCIGQ